MAPDDRGGVSIDAAAPSRRYLTLLVGSLSLIALACVTLLFPVPYVIMRPGPTFNTLGEFDGKPMITFPSGTRTYRDRGQIDFTTVSVTRPDAKPSLLEAVAAYFSADTSVVPRRLIYADDESAKQSRQRSQRQLASSKDSARVAGLRAAGYKVAEKAVVEAVGKKAPAAGHLRRGDVIIGVAGRETVGAQEVVDAVRTTKPGHKVTIEFKRKGVVHSVTLKTIADPLNHKRPLIGVGLTSQFKFPIQVSNHVGTQIGGPSAGSMFALAIYDRLTRGTLTGGLHVAGTGEIRPDGVISPIGGIRQKMAGAARAGATVFLVPSANCADARRGADGAGRVDGLELVRVRKLSDAITSLETLAKSPKAGGSSRRVPGCGGPH